MAKAILSVDEFLSTFRVGDQFWEMESYIGKPVGISGPYLIEQIVMLQSGSEKLPAVITDLIQTGEFICDITGEFKGAFKTEREAQVYFEERLLAFTGDKAWQAKYQTEVEIEDWMDKLYEGCY